MSVGGGGVVAVGVEVSVGDGVGVTVGVKVSVGKGVKVWVIVGGANVPVAVCGAWVSDGAAVGDDGGAGVAVAGAGVALGEEVGVSTPGALRMARIPAQ